MAKGTDFPDLNRPLHFVKDRLGRRHRKIVLMQKQQVDTVPPQPCQTPVNRRANTGRVRFIAGQLLARLVDGNADLGDNLRLGTVPQRPRHTLPPCQTT